MADKYICIDIGGTKILGAIVDEKDNIICEVKKKTKAHKGLEVVEERLLGVIEELLEKSQVPKEEIAAIGAGAPGVINKDTGEIIYSPNLPWKNYNIKKFIEGKLGIPFVVGNDANVGIMGEWKYGAAINKKNVVGIFVGTGIGGGLIVDDKLFTGANHLAGELGHMVINPEGPYCNCGQRGCLESYAGKVAMTREIKNQIKRGRESILKDLMDMESSVISSKPLKEAIEEKDALAVEVLDKAIYYLAAGTGSLINIFNPEMVVLGGGVIESLGCYIMPILKEYIKKFILPGMLEGTEIVESALGDHSIIYGALALAKEIK
ncbi:ROK family protein [Acetivibrio saccincola]|jgi:glucokinase|uniref:ROK family protein n=1 Tax=Acetivibrio saccincola TaxID=1677857 RepID=UPI000B23A942|nr:ROK family protein [Acetivibrio saccincola]NLW26169.1 ROK family protein [Acetivibrio saccincola]HOA97719.1 ROK family protein [Acetivibrio saccincola]HQD27882.1 ROK family protein [Acetivibrio saccincola]